MAGETYTYEAVFGTMIRQLRRDYRMTQHDICRRTKINEKDEMLSQSMVSRLERGVCLPLTDDTIKRVVRAFPEVDVVASVNLAIERLQEDGDTVKPRVGLQKKESA